MSKLRYFFYGYRKHYLVWVAFFAVIAAIVIFVDVFDDGAVMLGEVYAALGYVGIGAPVLAFITLSISKGSRKLFASKDIV
ncbi:MAG: hypothetical protein VYC65_03825, partial [Chloroflexota bacterium]|nr:hypothetical protein [Chloroflexota bacterium]